MSERWNRDPNHTHEQALASLVTWMEVQTSQRWKPEDGATWCDHYAMDFLDQLFGPRVVPFAASVWWTDKSLESIKAGSTPQILWPTTVKSNGAKGLNLWLKDWSTSYGWKIFKTEAEFYEWLNSPGDHIGAISTDGHVTIALPDLVNSGVETQGTIPLQTQAGSTNRQFFRSNSWYRNNKTRIFVGRDYPA
jgi:hypothetical protein